jgi:hypothetical protein
MEDQSESDTLAGVPLSKEQKEIFEKINSNARGIDFGSDIVGSGYPDSEATIVIDEPPTELIQGHLLNGGVSKLEFLEIKQHITKFENELCEQHEVMITPANFNHYSEIRLVSLIFYPSGAISLQCENKGGKTVTLFDHIGRLSFALTKSVTLSKNKRQRKVVFIFEPDNSRGLS